MCGTPPGMGEEAGLGHACRQGTQHPMLSCEDMMSCEDKDKDKDLQPHVSATNETEGKGQPAGRMHEKRKRSCQPRKGRLHSRQAPSRASKQGTSMHWARHSSEQALSFGALWGQTWQFGRARLQTRCTRLGAYTGYANKLVTSRRAIENNDTTHGQVLEPGASSDPLQIPICTFCFCNLVAELLVILQIPICTFCFVALWLRGLTALLSQCALFALLDVGRVSSAYAVFLFQSLRQGARHWRMSTHPISDILWGRHGNCPYAGGAAQAFSCTGLSHKASPCMRTRVRSEGSLRGTANRPIQCSFYNR
eukprot:1160223-Pelagomonas_calceolata.AAC.6